MGNESSFNRRILIVLFPIFVASLIFLFDMLLVLAQINLRTFEQEGGFKYEVYEYYSSKFQFDSIIWNISESCIGNDKVTCVFYKINEPYDWSRVGSPPLFRTPSEYFELGGICRDISVIRKSALNNLNVPCIFNFSESNHVFLNCEYDGKNWELNNGYLYVK